MRYWNNSNARCKLISAQVTDQDQRSSRAKTDYKNTQGLSQNSSEAPANYSTERTPDGRCHREPRRQRSAQGLGQRTPVCAQRSPQQRLCRAGAARGGRGCCRDPRAALLRVLTPRRTLLGTGVGTAAGHPARALVALDRDRDRGNAGEAK